MALFNLEIITPDKVFFQGEVEKVRLKGTEGYFEVLARHTNYVSAIMPDTIKFKTPEGDKHAFVSSGIVKVSGDKTVLVTDSAEWPEEIDINRALEAEKKAKDKLHQNKSMDTARAELALKRAIARQKTYKFK